MKLAIISDIHSNIHALKAVLAELKERGAPDVVVCAGDIVGYGAFPNESCKETAALSRHTVVGNHDTAALNHDVSSMNPYAAKAVLWTASRLDAESTEWLQSLAQGTRFRADDAEVVMYHGSVGSSTQYVFESEASESLITRARGDLLILGHTHVPFVKRFRSGIIVNPGSVGQPRDGDPRASFAIMDTQTRRCEIVRLDYDIEAAAKAIESAGLPRFLAERLSRGT